MAFLQGSFHAGSAFRLHTDNFDLRIQKFCQSGNAGSQSASSDRNQDIIHQRKLFYDLHSNGSLTGGNRQIVEGMDEGQAFFCLQLLCVLAGIIVNVAF